jgi:hypothetical protein
VGVMGQQIMHDFLTQSLHVIIFVFLVSALLGAGLNLRARRILKPLRNSARRGDVCQRFFHCGMPARRPQAGHAADSRVHVGRQKCDCRIDDCQPGFQGSGGAPGDNVDGYSDADHSPARGLPFWSDCKKCQPSKRMPRTGRDLMTRQCVDWDKEVSR